MQQLEMAGLAWGKRSQWSWTLSSPAGPVWVCLSEGLRRSDYGCSTNWWWFVSCCPGSTTHELSLVPSHQSCVFQLIGLRNSVLIAPDLQYRLLLLFIWSSEYVCTDSRCACGCHVGIPRAGMWAQLPFCENAGGRVCLIHTEIYTRAPRDFCGSRSGAGSNAWEWPSPALSYHKAGVPQDTRPRRTFRKNIKW